ncbi:MAG: hypothetical protein QOK36_794 [Gaiellales bacterium]|nr:hypothetical protein [Gaiellales bacterium]
MGTARAAARGERVDAGDVRRSPQVCERVSGGFQLQRRGVLVTERAARQPDEDADARGFERNVELLPRATRVTQRRRYGVGRTVPYPKRLRSAVMSR